MSKKYRSKKDKDTVTTTINNNIEIDYDKLADALVRANSSIKKQDALAESERNAVTRKEWYSLIGFKEYPDNEKLLKRLWHKLRNYVSVLWHMLWLREKDAKHDVAIFGLIRLSAYAIFVIIKWLLYLASVMLLVMAFCTFESSVLTFQIRPMYLLISLFAFLIAHWFRIAVFEIENMSDRNYLIGILSSVTGFIAMVIAVIALLVG